LVATPPVCQHPRPHNQPLPPPRPPTTHAHHRHQPEASKGRKVLVFCNSMDSCRAVEHATQERGLPTVCYHGDMPLQARREAMAAFAGPGCVCLCAALARPQRLAAQCLARPSALC
jgi:superfamily II DNA/RNA helicase